MKEEDYDTQLELLISILTCCDDIIEEEEDLCS
jgi:hypothetical protein